MRLIDSATLISKLPVVENDIQISLIGAVADMVCMISECPVVDAVEVVRCKDCEYSRPLTTSEKKVYVDECVVCLNAGASCTGYNVVWGDNFCSYGERKDNETV